KPSRALVASVLGAAAGSGRRTNGPDAPRRLAAGAGGAPEGEAAPNLQGSPQPEGTRGRRLTVERKRQNAATRRGSAPRTPPSAFSTHNAGRIGGQANPAAAGRSGRPHLTCSLGQQHTRSRCSAT